MKEMVKKLNKLYNNLSSSFECAESSPSSLSPWCRRQASQDGHSQSPRTQCPIGLNSRFFSCKEGLQNHPVNEKVYSDLTIFF